MATNTLKGQAKPGNSVSSELSLTDIAASIVAPLASLKLTVFLLVTAIAVVFIATLQQASLDMWTVKNMHYDSWFVTIPFQHLLIERWFPSYQDVQGSFVIPSGKLIIYALIINLVAAHVLRFRIKAKGVKLWLGLVTAAVAAVVTWAMSFNTLGTDGFQKAPPVSYAQMWLIMQVILLGLALGCVAGMFLTEKGKRAEKSILFTFAFLAAAVLGITISLGKDAFIGDAGMRILWQLAQSTIAACVAWGACILLFQRKAGIVLLHFGVVGLMANELYVTYTNDETQMSFLEGQASNVAIDGRATEFVVLDQSDPEFDEMVVVPESILKSGEVVSDERLPFSIKCENFYDNSSVSRASAPDPNLSGMGRIVEIAELPPNTGDGRDFASARVELVSNDGKSLGKWLVSQQLREFADSVSVDGKDYRIGIRFKTEYKPYRIKLNDVRAEFYAGTKTPSWYSSKIELTNLDTDNSSEHEVWMNNPLRYNGETFYQSGYDVIDGKEMSALQVVRNRGWMIPYICCMFTVVGLAGQFGSSLLAWLQKNQAKTNRTKEEPLVAELVEPASRKGLNWKSPGFLVPAGAAAIFGLYALSGVSKAIRPVEHESGMRLDRLGEIPVAYDGRVKPLDSFARNTARKFSKREFVFDGNLKKQHPMRWLADTLFEAEGHDKYRLFRIEDLEALQLLDLPDVAAEGEPKGVRFRYSPEQLANAPAEIQPLLGDAPDSWTPLQQRLAKINGQVQLVMGLNQAFNLGEQRGAAERMFRNGKYDKLPLSIPANDDNTKWTSIADADNKAWLQAKANETETTSVFALYEKLMNEKDSDTYSLSAYRQDEIDRNLLSVARAKGLFDGTESPTEVLDRMREDMPKNVSNALNRIVDSKLIDDLAAMNSDENRIQQEETRASKLAKLFKEMGVAYRAGDSEQFNSLTEDYLVTVRESEEVSSVSGKLAMEKIYNGWSPFYVSMVLYLIGFVAVALSWLMGFDPESNKVFGRTAVAIILVALLVQTIGLVMRVYISGRPPITNLYSSALFVSAVFVAVMLVVEKITKLGLGSAMAAIGAFGALMWAWTMSIVDGDTFSVLVAVLDTQFWLSTHVVCITIGYAVMFAAGFLALGYLLASIFTPAIDKELSKTFSNIIYGVTCFALFFSFFGTVLGGLWGDDSWGRFWGWDPKENGALMIVLWSALLLHARWGGLVKARGIAILAVLGNIIVLWSWKGVNSMGVGLHAYAGSEDNTVFWILMVGLAHLVVAVVALTPTKFWFSNLRT